MKNYSQHQQVVSMDRSDIEDRQFRRTASQNHLTNDQDDRYPGTFFRVPGVPMPGKTTWSLVK